MKLSIVKGATSVLVRVFLQDSSSSTGAGLTGLTSSSSGLVCYRARDDDGNAAGTQITLSAGTRGTWSSGGFVEKDSTHMPGVYEFGVPNNALASGSRSVLIMFTGATNLAPCPLEIELTGWDNQDGVHGGLSALPNTACTTNASLITSGTGTDQLHVSGGVADANAKQWLGGTIPAVNVTGVPKVDVVDWLGVAPNALISGRVDTDPGALQSGVITASSIAAAALNGKGDWLLASSYTAPPSAATIATTVWQDLTASSDFTTAASIGKLLVTDIDAAISSRLATSGYTAPPTAAAVATAVWTDTTSSDFATTSSPGKILVTQLGGAWTTTASSVFTTASLANAPGGGGSVTVGGYASGQDPATLVLGATASSWNSAGTIGQKINAAGGAADPLGNQVPGSYASGTAGYVLGHVNPAQVTVTSPVGIGGDFAVVAGCDYKAADGRSIDFTDSASTWPNLTAASAVTLTVYPLPGSASLTPVSYSMSFVTVGSSNQKVRLELTAAQTATMPSGQFKVVATLSDGDQVNLVRARATVTQT